MPKDYRVRISVKNNVLLEAIEFAGYKMGLAFCNLVGISYHTISGLVAMRDSPMINDNWKPTVIKLAEFLHTTPDRLFNPCHLNPVAKSFVERRVDQQEVVDLLLKDDVQDPVQALEHQDMVDIIDKSIETLSDNEKIIIERNVMGGEALDDVAQSLKLSRERVRQLKARALRKLQAIPTMKQLIGWKV